MRRHIAWLIVLSGCASWHSDEDGFNEADRAQLMTMVLGGADAQSQLGPEVAVGQRFFFDRCLDVSDAGASVSCATCHDPAHWYSDGRPSANVSATLGGFTGRNSPSLVNVGGYEKTFSWDGTVTSLPQQVEVAFLKTMHGTTAKACAEWVRVNDAGSCADADAGAAQLYVAWAAYSAALASGDSPFDRFVLGDSDALLPEQKRGLSLFLGKAGCVQCHKGKFFTDNALHVVGIGQSGVNVGVDKGNGRFRTKGLRNVAFTAPYFHAGQLTSLAEVVAFYDRGGDHQGTQPSDSFLVPLDLTDGEQADLVAFLEALSGVPVDAQLTIDTGPASCP